MFMFFIQVLLHTTLIAIGLAMFLDKVPTGDAFVTVILGAAIVLTSGALLTIRVLGDMSL